MRFCAAADDDACANSGTPWTTTAPRDELLYRLLRAVGEPQPAMPFFRLPLSLQDLPLWYASSGNKPNVCCRDKHG